MHGQAASLTASPTPWLLLRLIQQLHPAPQPLVAAENALESTHPDPLPGSPQALGILAAAFFSQRALLRAKARVTPILPPPAGAPPAGYGAIEAGGAPAAAEGRLVAPPRYLAETRAVQSRTLSHAERKRETVGVGWVGGGGGGRQASRPCFGALSPCAVQPLA
jgi:hypothetical protein